MAEQCIVKRKYDPTHVLGEKFVEIPNGLLKGQKYMTLGVVQVVKAAVEFFDTRPISLRAPPPVPFSDTLYGPHPHFLARVELMWGTQLPLGAGELVWDTLYGPPPPP